MKVIVAAFTGLGNSILLTPMISALRETYGSTLQIKVIGDDKYLALSILNGLPQVELINATGPDDVQLQKAIQGATAAFLPRFGNTPWLEKALRRQRTPIVKHFDSFTVDPSHKKYKLIHRLRYFFKRRWDRQTTYVPITPGRHEAELNLDLLRAQCQLTVKKYKAHIGVQPNREFLRTFQLHDKSYIVFQPSVANGNYSSKRWDPVNFLDLAEKLQTTHPRTFLVLIGDEGDRKSLQSVLWPTNVMNLMGQTSISQLVTLIQYAKLNVTHDSGAMHIAVALGVPLLALLGPTDFYRTGPYSVNDSGQITCIYSQNEHLAEMYNFNMMESESSRLSPNYEAMQGIHVDQVYSLICDRTNA